MPKSVSVIIPAFNVASCISTAIHSALSQSTPPLEIIVIDDASTDDTASIVDDIARVHKSVRMIQMPINQGAAAARNVGLDNCSSEWIALLDSDDRYLPHRLEYLTTTAESAQLDFAADNFYNYDVFANQVVGVAIPKKKIGTRLLLDRYDFVRNCMTNMAGAVDLGLLKPIMRRNFIQRFGLRYRDDIRHGEDFFFYLAALVNGAKFAVFPEPHYIYTQRLGSISGRHSAFTRTRVDLSEIEIETRRIAESQLTENDSLLAALLLSRADRLRAARNFYVFRAAVTEGEWIRAARHLLEDKETQNCALQSLKYKIMSNVCNWTTRIDNQVAPKKAPRRD